MASNDNKFYKKAVREQQRRIRPGECQKYVRIILDETFSKDVYEDLKDLNINVEFRTIGEKCIYWERNLRQHQILSNDDLALKGRLNEDWHMEQQVLKVLSKEEYKHHLKQNSLLKVAQVFRAAFPNKHTILILPCIKDKNDESSNESARAVVELQILAEMPSIQIAPNAIALNALLARFTKSIAEAPYKQQKSQSLCIFKKFLGNDNKQCVRVSGTTGFGRLWQQHLCRLPLVTLDVAEAIREKYKSPKMLIDAYKNDINAVNSIADIRLTRGAGPEALLNPRRIGNALSTKLYTLYNTRDPNACI